MSHGSFTSICASCLLVCLISSVVYLCKCTYSFCFCLRSQLVQLVLQIFYSCRVSWQLCTCVILCSLWLECLCAVLLMTYIIFYWLLLLLNIMLWFRVRSLNPLELLVYVLHLQCTHFHFLCIHHSRLTCCLHLISNILHLLL